MQNGSLLGALQSEIQRWGVEHNKPQCSIKFKGLLKTQQELNYVLDKYDYLRS